VPLQGDRPDGVIVTVSTSPVCSEVNTSEMGSDTGLLPAASNMAAVMRSPSATQTRRSARSSMRRMGSFENR
jgi:hypothetical protein